MMSEHDRRTVTHRRLFLSTSVCDYVLELSFGTMRDLSAWLMLLVVHLAVIPFVGGNNTHVSNTSLDLGAVTAKIIKSCYGERIMTIGVAGNVSDSFVASIFSGDPISIVLLNGDENSVTNEAVSPMSRHKLEMFAITATSPSAFRSLLVHIKRSRWWNHMAQFYVFHSPDKRMGCTEASKFLWAAWKMDLLGVKFVCNDGDRGSLIYMFNPYTKNAPAPWKLVRTRKGLNNHPWTLFARRYFKNANNCKNIDFDQTRDPGGYEVRLTAVVRPSMRGQLSQFPVINRRMCTISSHMNIKFKVIPKPGNVTLGFIDEDGKGHGMVADLINGRSDMILRVAPLSVVPELPGSYPIYVKLFAVTRYTGYPSQWEKVTTAVDFPSRIGVLIVTMVTVIFLKYALRQPFMIAFLNAFRVIICNGSFTKLPTKLGPRVYLLCLLWFVIVIQALYQGQLAARLSKHDRYPNVNNKRDLMKSHYLLCGREIDRVIFSDDTYEGRFIPLPTFLKHCTDYVLQNSSIACVSGWEYLVNETLESKLHMSRDSIAESPIKNLLRRDWPLEGRLHRHYSRYTESGIESYYDKQLSTVVFRTLDVNENGSGDDSFRVLYLADLDFAFAILGIGLGSAIISFAIELCFAYFQPKKKVRPFIVRKRRRLVNNFIRK